MSHVDPELIALRALGAELSTEAEDHVSTCPQCSRELAALVEVVELGRGLEEPGLVDPPASVWAGIAAATGVPEQSHRADTEPREYATGGPPKQLTGGGADPLRRRGDWTLAAAIAGVLAGAGAVIGWQAIDGDAQPDAPALVAEAVLDPLPDRTATGVAQVVDGEAERRLVLTVDADDEVDGYLEVWLLRPDVSGMVSLGVLVGQTTELVIPDGLDLADFSVVDVSIEPYNGDPTHSGDSLVRGQLVDV